MNQPNPNGHPKPRVFVSSVIEGFEIYRQRAREAILQAGGEPVLVNEDFPSHAVSSRNVCLDAIESCDFLVLLIGARGGWITPSGKLVIEEEFEHARGRKLPVLVFLEDVRRESNAEALVKRVSDYITGAFRTSFADVNELYTKVTEALSMQFAGRDSVGIDMDKMDSLLKGVLKVEHQCVLRYVLMPERVEEVIAPIRLGSDLFGREVLEIGHSGTVDLLQYEYSTTCHVDRDSLLVRQGNDGSNRGARNVVHVEIAENGRIVIDINVTGRKQNDDSSSIDTMFVLAAEDIEDVLKRCFMFCHAFYEKLDPFGRHQSFYFDCALGNVEYRKLERNPKPRNTWSMGSSPRENPLRLLTQPRKVSRGDLASPEPEIERVLEYAGRILRD